jgi:hypothetical protein
MLVQFLWGTLAMACFTVATFFLKFWRTSRDRFLLAFAIAFVALGLNWVGLALLESQQESRNSMYVVRLIAFLIILAAIIDKNRARRAPGR